MKKAKIMLMVIAVLAVIGGTLAFEANTFQQYRIFSCVGSEDGLTCSYDAAAGIGVTFGNKHYTYAATITDLNLNGQNCEAAHCYSSISTQPE
jgi:hypothetical protein